MRQGLFRNVESQLLRPAEELLCRLEGLFAQRLPMCGGLVLFRAAITYVAPNDDQRRPFDLVPCIAYGRVYAGNIISVRYSLHVPSVCRKARGNILGESQGRIPFDGNMIVVI